ncbi:MAG TPA: phosphatidylinositol-specific phospholipase C domain-containing protein [Bacteroidales bacterium]|nr:phosphatidylinositol-specific phospholipase C domain-containing protein [Bacteroidales bacterium]
MIKVVLICFVLFVCCCIQTFSQCYSCYELREKRYNETAFLTTHNSFNCEEGDFQMPNQTYSISNQLNDGVRALMIDVYDKNGIPTVYHGVSILGSVPLSSNLAEIKTFLDNNNTEIVTIIFECNVSADMIEQAFIDANLYDYLYKKNDLLPWPTLEEMINSNKRLVVFTDVDDASELQKWYHYAWDYAVETNFTVHGTDEFTCDYNRGEPENDLFIFNHFITSTVGTGNIEQATTANSNPFFISRIFECMDNNEKLPNFITVDFYETGDCCDVVNTLNDMYSKSEEISNMQIQIFPQPAENIIVIQGNNIMEVLLYDINGKMIKQINNVVADKITFNLAGLDSGIYSLKINCNSNICMKRFVKI